ncbi:MAG: hypothetical protein H0V17_21210 [Deltaproteobacteria bacterium]|nr:hypothetical protein [Deltaproteobacteria bacterium]
MGAISKNVISEGEWCAPTRELKNSKLLKLVHQSRKIITETTPCVVEVTPQEDVVMLVNRKPEPPVTDAPEAIVAAIVTPEPEVDEVAAERREAIARTEIARVAIAPFTVDAEGSAAQYPVYRDRFRSLRVAFALMSLAAVAAVLFVMLAR